MTFLEGCALITPTSIPPTSVQITFAQVVIVVLMFVEVDRGVCGVGIQGDELPAKIGFGVATTLHTAGTTKGGGGGGGGNGQGAEKSINAGCCC